jgi:site-specific recombinase XerD
MEAADLRERAIISMLALGGFREGTLIKLRYGHVREDLSRGVMPLHIHIEAEITKGKYHDYDTFLGQEAVEYLKLYLEVRRLGSPDGKLPPETLNDDSPLIRDSRSQIAKHIGERQIYQLVHGLYFKAGLLKPNNGKGYDLHVHSLRKFFKTQLMALGIQSDYIDYMMGHTVDTYNDIESKGIEFLRNIYASAGLSIKPRAQVSKVEMVKEFIRGLGMNPEEILTRQTMAEPHRIYARNEEREEDQIRALCLAFKESLKKELTAS